jgi:hypothetical protein
MRRAGVPEDGAVSARGPIRVTRGVRLLLLGFVGVLAGAACSAPDAPTPGTTSATAPVTAPSSTASATAPSSAGSAAPGPLVASATWVRGSGGRSLHVVPTAAGRAATGPSDEARAWAEVLRIVPDADQPGMQAQFDCHWVYARLVQPDKPSWNLEPWRPVVTDQRMVDARCNPGGQESADG